MLFEQQEREWILWQRGKFVVLKSENENTGAHPCSSRTHQVICLRECDLYCYKSDLETDPFGEKASIWSFNYFFYNKKMKRILYFSCRAVSKKSLDEEVSVCTWHPRTGPSRCLQELGKIAHRARCCGPAVAYSQVHTQHCAWLGVFSCMFTHADTHVCERDLDE